MRGEAAPQDVALRGQGLGPPITKALQQHRRPLDVAEEQRDRPGRKTAHV